MAAHSHMISLVWFVTPCSLVNVYKLFGGIPFFTSSGKKVNARVGKVQQIEIRECILSFCAESFVFQFTVQKCKD